MQVEIKLGNSGVPQIVEMSDEKASFLMQFIDYLIGDEIDEKSLSYQQFLEAEVKKALKTKRIKSGNSLREIL